MRTLWPCGARARRVRAARTERKEARRGSSSWRMRTRATALMGSVADRYCANGEDCVHYKHIGGPVKLTKYNPNVVCDVCHQAGRRPVDGDQSEQTGSNEDSVDTVGAVSDGGTRWESYVSGLTERDRADLEAALSKFVKREIKELEAAGWERVGCDTEKVLWRDPESGYLHPRDIAISILKKDKSDRVTRGDEGYRYKYGVEEEGTAVDLLRHRVSRKTLYDFGISEWTNLPGLANLWLEELKNVGLQELDEASGAPAKEGRRSSEDYLYVDSPRGQRYPVRLKTGQVAWLQCEAERTELGYRRVRVLDQVPLTDKAILAALTVLEIQPRLTGDKTNTKRKDVWAESPSIDVEGLKEALSLIEPPLKKSAGDYMVTRNAIEAFLLRPPEEYEEFRQRVRNTPKGMVEERLGHQSRDLEYVMALLRYYRSDFDNLPHEDQLALIERTCTHVNAFLDALQNLVSMLEYGTTKGLPKKIISMAQEDVDAAVLKGFEEISNPELAERLNLPPTVHDDVHRDHQVARKKAERGTKILRNGLGEKGRQRLIEGKRAEATRYCSLSDDERCMEEIAEANERPVEGVWQDYAEWWQTQADPHEEGTGSDSDIG
jgi:hypothetical protein